jgi:hypothetical protein
MGTVTEIQIAVCMAHGGISGDRDGEQLSSALNRTGRVETSTQISFHFISFHFISFRSRFHCSSPLLVLNILYCTVLYSTVRSVSP